MIRMKYVFDDLFKSDITKAIENNKYEVISVEKDTSSCTASLVVEGHAYTENHGVVEFSFKTERLLKPYGF